MFQNIYSVLSSYNLRGIFLHIHSMIFLICTIFDNIILVLNTKIYSEYVLLRHILTGLKPLNVQKIVVKNRIYEKK